MKNLKLTARAALVLWIGLAASVGHAELGDPSESTPTFMKGPQGWFWNEDREVEEQKAKAKPPAPAVPPAPSQDEIDLAKHKAFTQALDESIKIATINPTDANMKRVLSLMAESRRKATVFTDAGTRVAALTPAVDDRYNGMNMRPPSPAATKVWDMEQDRDFAARMAVLSKTHGIFFFFKSDCPYCHAFAPILKRFANRYGLTIFPVSMDGGALAEFPRPQINNGIAAKFLDQLGIPYEQFAVPFTVLAKPSTREVLPIGMGLMNEAELTERLTMFAREADRAAQDPRSPGWTGQAASTLVGTNVAAKALRSAGLVR